MDNGRRGRLCCTTGVAQPRGPPVAISAREKEVSTYSRHDWTMARAAPQWIGAARNTKPRER